MSGEGERRAPSRPPEVLVWQRAVGASDDERLPDTGWRPDNLRKKGFAPATIVDVGVGPGTAGFHEAFPDAHLVLVEPLVEFEPQLRELARSRGEYHLLALGASEGEGRINVETHKPTSSSLMRRPRTRAVELEERVVPMTTLDALRERCGWSGPFGLKIDTEGFEREVILGAGRTLAETQFVVAEVSVARRYEMGYTFAEFVAMMDERGFDLVDVLDGQKSRDGEVVLFLDCLFRARGARSGA